MELKSYLIYITGDFFAPEDVAIYLSFNYLANWIQINGKMGTTVYVKLVAHLASPCVLNCHFPHFLWHPNP